MKYLNLLLVPDNEHDPRTHLVGKTILQCGVFIIALLSLIVLAGCSVLPVNGPDFDAEHRPTIDSGKATIFVYRHGKGPVMAFGAVTISIDGTPVFDLKNDGYTWFYVQPGQHIFLADWPITEKPLSERAQFDPQTLSITVAAGKTYYVNYKIEQSYESLPYLEKLGEAGKPLQMTHTLSVKLANEMEADALRNLKGCKFQSGALK